MSLQHHATETSTYFCYSNGLFITTKGNFPPKNGNSNKRQQKETQVILAMACESVMASSGNINALALIKLQPFLEGLAFCCREWEVGLLFECCACDGAHVPLLTDAASCPR
eukprot:3935613-Amphidinium_carterae.2